MADNVGVDKETWDGVVDAQATAMSNVSSLKAEKLSKTTLKRFTGMLDLEDKFNTVLASLKTYTTNNTAKMKSAGDIIVQEDAAAAQNIDQNTRTARFE